MWKELLICLVKCLWIGWHRDGPSEGKGGTGIGQSWPRSRVVPHLLGRRGTCMVRGQEGIRLRSPSDKSSPHQSCTYCQALVSRLTGSTVATGHVSWGPQHGLWLLEFSEWWPSLGSLDSTGLLVAQDSGQVGRLPDSA